MHTSTETHQAGPQGLRFRLIAGEYNTGSLRASWIFRFNETNVDVSRFRTVVSFLQRTSNAVTICSACSCRSEATIWSSERALSQRPSRGCKLRQLRSHA